MFISLPAAVLQAIRALNVAGFEAYAVGGCVRDSLLGKKPLDWDITTSATPAQMQSVFANDRTVETGIQHGTLTVLIDNTPLEITTYRLDGVYSDGRHPDTVSFTTSLEEDLRRRDFTINAMAYHPNYGVVDPFGGREDLQRKMIRCVGTPTERFAEDALRIIRALRFASVLGFSIDEATANAVSELSYTLCRVSTERICAEFRKLLCGTYAEHICKAYSQVLIVFLPEINNCTDFHILSKIKPIFRSRLSALFYSADVSVIDAENALHRLRVEKKTIRDVSLILTPLSKGTFTEDAYLLRLLNRLGSEMIFDYLLIRESDKDTINRVHQLLAAQACYHPSMLEITGEDIMAAGIPQGPAVGKALNDLLYAVIDGLCENKKSALLSYITKSKKPVP